MLCYDSKPVNSMPREWCCRPHMGLCSLSKCMGRRAQFSEGLCLLRTTKPVTRKYMKYIREHVASDTPIRGSRPTFLMSTRASESSTYHCRSCLWCLRVKEKNDRKCFIFGTSFQMVGKLNLVGSFASFFYNDISCHLFLGMSL